MARKGDGTDDVILDDGTFTVPASWTYHIDYQNAIGQTTGDGQPCTVGVGTAGSNERFGFSWDHDTAAFRGAWFQRDSGGSYTSARYTTVMAVDTWHRITGRYDGTDLEAFYQGLEEATTTTSAHAAGTGGKVCMLAGQEGSSAFDDGRIARVALWDVALTDGEILSLGSGLVSPSEVRNANLVRYYELYGTASPEVDWSGNGGVATVTGATQADHSPAQPPFADFDWQGAFTVAAVGGANPKGPLGHPLYGALAGPVAA
jgi:hypothetical protein